LGWKGKEREGKFSFLITSKMRGKVLRQKTTTLSSLLLSTPFLSTLKKT